MNCLTLWNICFFSIYISYLFKRKRTWEAARTYDRHLHKTYLIPIWYKRYDLSFSHGAGALWTDGLKTEQWWRMDENVYKVSIYLEYIFFYESRLLGMAGNILWHFNLSDGRYLFLCTLYFEENVDKLDIFLESF